MEIENTIKETGKLIDLCQPNFYDTLDTLVNLITDTTRRFIVIIHTICVVVYDTKRTKHTYKLF